jgi:hypothetical protein
MKKIIINGEGNCLLAYQIFDHRMCIYAVHPLRLPEWNQYMEKAGIVADQWPEMSHGFMIYVHNIVLT